MMALMNYYYSKTRVLLVLVLVLHHLPGYGNAGGNIPGIELSMPPSHIALSGDYHIQITSSSFPPLMLQLSRLEGNTAQPLTTFPVLPEARALTLNTTLVTIPCGYFSKGGQYYILIKQQPFGINNSTSDQQENNDSSSNNNVITRSLDVRWPMPQLSLTPEHVQTYPENPVNAILEFPDAVCQPVSDRPATALPEFWLELHYCGHSLLTCDNSYESLNFIDDNSDSGASKNNKTSVQVLYSEQVRALPGSRVLTLRCELFGLAGHYALFLRPTTPAQSLPHTAAYVKADWSEQFVFNVHARSIFPCDVHSGGITVLFQYPSCILASGDRVRLFARLRANVASLAPPTSLVYVAEQRVTRGQHSLHFDCDLFTERYVEYCFVYVSQAISGAVADVRMDCVPTLPVTETESGGWGPWSAWTPCSSTCIGGTRSRYRFCDSPPPRYGAKFCEGQAVETEKCGKSIGNSWECFYGNGISAGDIAAEIPEIQAEVGPYCRCGCVVHLGQVKPKRLLATSSQSCPGRTFWLIQADDDCIIQFKVEQFHLPCGTQWLKVRDGSSLSSNLLADLTGAPDSTPALVNSSGPNLLLEFFSDEIATVGGQICGGGFLAHASQIGIGKKSNVTAIPIAQSIGVVPTVILKMTAVHIAAIFFLSGLLLATALLGAQYLFRYRKYQVAQAEDQDSLADPMASCASISMRTRASSSATLLSEVISLTRLRPAIKTRKNKHSRLRESLDCEQAGNEDEDEFDEEDEDQEVTLAKEESLSLCSTTTLTTSNQQQETLTTTAKSTVVTLAADEIAEEEAGRMRTTSTSTTYCTSLPTSPQSYNDNCKMMRRSSTTTLTSNSEKDKLSGKDDDDEEYDENDEEEVLLSASKKSGNIVGGGGNSNGRRLSNVSTTTLTHGFYSPASSLASRATIRSTTSNNAKETKEKRNREKLLAGPQGATGSDFSIVGPDADLEMDYYDYNVTNAGAAPGSYLGMDPAFLVWIPPLDEEGEILPADSENGEIVDDDLRPKIFIDPGSNKESPEEEMLLPKIEMTKLRRQSGDDDETAVTPTKCSPFLNRRNKKVKIHPLNEEVDCNNQLREELKEPLLLATKSSTSTAVEIQLHDLSSSKCNNKKCASVGSEKLCESMEKETKVEKSPSIDSNILDEIRFADDEEDEETEEEQEADRRNIGSKEKDFQQSETQCNISYQDSNILSSS